MPSIYLMSLFYSLCETGMNAVHTWIVSCFHVFSLGRERDREEWADGRCIPESGMQQIGYGPYREVSQGLEAPPS